MSDQLLREALHSLADDAPAIDTTESTSGRTWQRARAARRRGILAVSLAAALVLVGGFLAIGLTSTQRPTPAKPPPYNRTQLAIPDTVWRPSPWTSSTSDDGPLGPLALISTAPHRDSWFHTDQDAVFGVSAVNGDYRFIDLPDSDFGGFPQAKIALSPDGTKIGYWLLGNVASNLRQSDDVGFAIYDTVTGHVSRHPVTSRYGLAPMSLTWTGDSSRLVASFGQYEANTQAGAGTSDFAPALAWDPVSQNIRALGPLNDSLSTGFGSTVTTIDSRGRLVVVDGHTGRRGQFILGKKGSAGSTSSPGGQRVAFGAGFSEVSWSTGGIAADELYLATRPTDVSLVWPTRRLDTHSPKTQAIGWVDSTHLLVDVWTSTRMEVLARHHIASLNVETGQLTTVVEFLGRTQTYPSVAVAMIGHPFAAGHEPSARDPRVVPVIIAVAIGLGLITGLLVLLYRHGRRYPLVPINRARL